MTEENLNQEIPPQPEPISVGAILRNAREAAGLTEETVARELCMPLSKVRAIETDDFGRLNSDTFIRGYLRAYAKLLKLDGDEIVGYYQAQVSGQQPLEDTVPELVIDAGRPVWKLVGAVALLMLVLWLVSVWFLGNRSGQEVAAPATVLQPSSPLEPGLIEDVISTTEAEPVVLGSDIATDEQELINGEAPVAVAPPAVETQSELPLDVLHLSFSDECWLEVIDAEGDVLHTDLMRAGRELQLEGRAPFQVKVGNIQVVAINLNGESVALNYGPNVRLVNLTVGE